MTEITERRLKCDYCGNVSPVLEGGKLPMGWAVYYPPLNPNDRQDFCQMSHMTAWLDIAATADKMGYGKTISVTFRGLATNVSKNIGEFGE